MFTMKTFIIILLVIVIVKFFLDKKNEESYKKRKLVVYFSATGNTKTVAEKLAKAAGADIYEIKPSKPYTKEDLDWDNENSRCCLEMKSGELPPIVNDKFFIDNYDLIFLGFPIWFYMAPSVINSFLDKQNCMNKTFVLFGTSGGSGFEKTVENLKPNVTKSTIIIPGKIFKPNVPIDALSTWIGNFK